MAQINKPTDYFNTKLYTGNGSTQSITGVGFQPDMVWTKVRSTTDNHNLEDAVRGAGETLYPDLTLAEYTDATAITSFDSDGYSIGSQGNVNANTQTFVSWNWLASNTTASNTDGSITSTVSANTTAGFSIATYTGNNTNAQTIGHGLGVAPKVYIIKRRDSTSAWGMYHGSLGANKYLQLESTNAEATDTGIWNNTAPTSSVLSIGNAGYFNNASGGTYVCYAFAEKNGYSKFGSYTGNGNADGAFIYTGFKPAFVITKCSSNAENWDMFDNKRNTFNVVDKILKPSATNGESTFTTMDFVSNGFKHRNSDAEFNSSGRTYIYMAFAEEPLVGTNNIPATAR